MLLPAGWDVSALQHPVTRAHNVMTIERGRSHDQRRPVHTSLAPASGPWGAAVRLPLGTTTGSLAQLPSRRLLPDECESSQRFWDSAPSMSSGGVRAGAASFRRMPTIDRRELAAIFAGGVLGALARVGLVELLPQSGTEWPWATFIVNVAGTFLLGYFATRLQERLPVSAYRRPLLGTGFCGALTTFSTVQVEVLRMLDANELGLAAAYVTASVVAGLGAVRIATGMVRRVRALA